MQPLRIDFAPIRPAAPRVRWYAGGAGALMLASLSAAWLLTPHAEAGRMGETLARPLPGAEEIQAADAAVRRLNFPWIEALAALEAACADPAEARLEGITSDLAHGSLRITGSARSGAAALALPDRLNANPAIAAAALQSQEAAPGMTALPVRFVLELQLRDPA